MKMLIITSMSVAMLFGCANYKPNLDFKNPHMTTQVGDRINKKHLKPFQLDHIYEYPITKQIDRSINVGMATYSFKKVDNRLEIVCTLTTNEHFTEVRSGVWFTDDNGVVIARRQLINSPDIREAITKDYVEHIPYADFKHMNVFFKCKFYQ